MIKLLKMIAMYFKHLKGICQCNKGINECTNPVSFKIDNITDTSALLKWSRGKGSNLYTLRYKNTNLEDYIIIDKLTNDNGKEGVIIDNLTPDTNYTVEIKIYCSAVWEVCKFNTLSNNKDLSLKFSNISSATLDEVNRPNRTIITEIDKSNSRFKCDIRDISHLKTQGVNGQPWFICQGNEATNFCEVVDIDNDGWIYYSTSWLGNMNMNLGESVEFFNPFTNYEILNNECPTLATERSYNNNFQGYPKSLNGKYFKYLIHGGILKKKSDNNYRAYICAVGSGETYVAEDSDINGNFKIISQTPFFEGVEYPIGRAKGAETLMWGITPVDKGFFREYPETCYIGLLGVKDGGISNAYKANYPGYILLDDDGCIVSGEKIREAKLINTYLSAKSSWDGGWHITGLALLKDNWHLVVKNWNQVKMAREVWHIIIGGEYQHNLIDILEGDDINAIEKAYLLHKGNDYISSPSSIFYAQSDFNLFAYKNQLYCFYFFEPKKTGYVNSMNRMCGIAIWDDANKSWNYQNGLQLINPVQLFRKYPHLWWCYDHWGNLCCHFIENNNIYIATNLGTDNPDYFPAILKLNIK